MSRQQLNRVPPYLRDRYRTDESEPKPLPDEMVRLDAFDADYEDYLRIEPSAHHSIRARRPSQ